MSETSPQHYSLRGNPTWPPREQGGEHYQCVPGGKATTQARKVRTGHYNARYAR